jgi:glycine oxidase
LSSNFQSHINNSIDYIIVGQGLAGSAVAMRLIEAGKSILVIDQPSKNRSSAIAAGLFNPITGKLMTKTWLADLLFPELHQFYTKTEQYLDGRFYFPHTIYRPFISIEEQNEWMGKSEDAAIAGYIEAIYLNSNYGHQVHDPYGGIVLKQCGYLDTKVFLEKVRTKLDSTNSFLNESFDEDSLIITAENVQYKNFTARKIIFCTGTAQLKSRLVSGVPIRPLKGETLLIQIAENPEQIYNRGVFIVSAAEKNQFRVGSTYESRELTELITEAGRKELQQKLDDLLVLPYQLVGQDWGIRPTSPDRKPMLGVLPAMENVVFFNGLGTKGVSLAPYFSKQLVAWLLGNGKLQPEVNISRFKSLSSKFREAV